MVVPRFPRFPRWFPTRWRCHQMACSSWDELVTLRDGQSVRLEVALFGLDLEKRGHSLRVVDDRLQVLPVDGLSPHDVATIRRHRDELMTMVRYDHPPA